MNRGFSRNLPLYPFISFPLKKEEKAGDFPGHPVVKTTLPLQEAQVLFLVGELKILHDLQCRKKKKKKVKKKS